MVKIALQYRCVSTYVHLQNAWCVYVHVSAHYSESVQECDWERILDCLDNCTVVLVVIAELPSRLPRHLTGRSLRSWCWLYVERRKP